MNVHYWLPDSEERNHKLSDIPSPTDMAKAIERVRMLHVKHSLDGEHYCGTCAYPAIWGEWQVYPCQTIRALDSEEWL